MGMGVLFSGDEERPPAAIRAAAGARVQWTDSPRTGSGDGRPDEGGEAEEGPGPERSEPSEGHDEQDEAEAIADGPDGQGPRPREAR